MDPKVSVIIPTYNRARSVSSAIQSVLDQTFEDFEIIVVDDGSTDNTKEVIKSFKDKKIHYLRHIKNKGSQAARNTGIKHSKGKFIAFLDDDDMWLPQKLERQLTIIEDKPDIGVIYTGFVFISDGKVYYVYTPSLRGNIYYDVLKKTVAATSTVLLRRECFNKVGFFDEHLPRYEDWDLWIRLAKHFKFDFIKEPLVLCRFHEGFYFLPCNAVIQLEGRKLMFKKYSIELDSFKKIKGLWHCRIGSSCCRCGKMDEAKKEFIEAIENDPHSIIYYVLLLSSFLGSTIYSKMYVVAAKTMLRFLAFKVIHP